MLLFAGKVRALGLLGALGGSHEANLTTHSFWNGLDTEVLPSISSALALTLSPATGGVPAEEEAAAAG